MLVPVDPAFNDFVSIDVIGMHSSPTDFFTSRRESFEIAGMGCGELPTGGDEIALSAILTVAGPHANNSSRQVFLEIKRHISFPFA